MLPAPPKEVSSSKSIQALLKGSKLQNLSGAKDHAHFSAVTEFATPRVVIKVLIGGHAELS